jgi:hypothetical protein
MCNKTVGFMSYTGKSLLFVSFTLLFLSCFLFYSFLFIRFFFLFVFGFLFVLLSFQFLFLIYSFPPFCLFYFFLCFLDEASFIFRSAPAPFPKYKNPQYCNSIGTNLSPRCSVFLETLTLSWSRNRKLRCRVYRIVS